MKYVKTDVLMNVLSIKDSIINYASDNSIDLIVIGTKERIYIERFVLGSIADVVAKQSH